VFEFLPTIVALVLFQGTGDNKQEPPPEEPKAEAIGTPYEVTGDLEFRYIGRWTDGWHDHDLFGYTRVDIGDPHEKLFTAHFEGSAAVDLDRNRSADNPFLSIEDTYNGDVTGRLYAAHLDLNSVEGNPVGDAFQLVRLGRQILYQTPETLFVDGLLVRTVPAESALGLTAEAMVGVPNHLFESSSKGDTTYGAAVTVQPWLATEVRFDYLHVDDEYLGTTDRNDLFGARWTERFGQSVYLAAHMNMLESDPRDLGVHLSWTPVDDDLSIVTRYTALLSDQTRRSIDLDYFTTVMGTYYSYHQYELFVHKGFADQLSLDGGVQFRELATSANQGTFNHEFRRYYFGPTLSGWPGESTELSLLAEYWDASGDKFSTLSFDVSQTLAESWKCSIGTSFDLFRYDALLAQEDENVYVYYARLRHDLSDSVQLRARFEFEDGEREDFGTFRLSFVKRL